MCLFWWCIWVWVWWQIKHVNHKPKTPKVHWLWLPMYFRSCGQNWCAGTFILCGRWQNLWRQRNWSHAKHLKEEIFVPVILNLLLYLWKVPAEHQMPTFHKSSQHSWIDPGNFGVLLSPYGTFSTLSHRPHILIVKRVSECSSLSSYYISLVDDSG